MDAQMSGTAQQMTITCDAELSGLMAKAQEIYGDNAAVHLLGALVSYGRTACAQEVNTMAQELSTLPAEAQEAVKIQIEWAKGPKAATPEDTPAPPKAAASGPAQPTKPKRRGK